MKISCFDKEIQEILSSGYYKIPRFQRPYSWQREQIEDFWTDVITDSENDYFIGSIVVFKADRDEFGVVDGQQRLTTITMLLCSVRNALHKHGHHDLANGVQTYVEKRNRDNKLRFILDTETSYPYLHEYIQKNGSPEKTTYKPGLEEKNLELAFKILTEFVSGGVAAIEKDTTKSEEQKQVAISDRLIAIRDKVLDLKLIIIELDDEDDAYVAFETLNTRGKDLTVSDLVKNHLTKLVRVENTNVDIARDNWIKVVETIEGSQASINVDSFLHHFWLSKYEYTSIKQLFRLLKKRVKTGDAARSLLETFLSDSKTYREIHESSFRKWDKQDFEIEKSLDALLIFNVKQPLPMMLAVLREYKNKNIKQKHAKNIIKSIENFHFIFSAITSQRSSGGISSMYAKSARELTKASNLAEKVKVLNELEVKLQDRIPGYQEFEANFLEVFYSDEFTKRKPLVRYILAKINSHHVDGLTIDYSQMTIEHIASQNPSESKLGQQPIASLGNLLLIDHELNRKLGNKEFSKKKQLLRKSDVWIDETIADAIYWGEDEINHRTMKLAEIAYKLVWNI